MTDPLDDAFRALREEHTGDHAEPDASLTQVLRRTRTQQKKRRTWQLALPIAAVLAASTAWAGATGRLQIAMRNALAVVQPAPPPPPRGSVALAKPAALESAPREAPVAPAPPVLEPPPTAAHAPEPPVAPSAPAAPRFAASPRANRDAGAADPHAALFAEAHRLHFVAHDAAAALRAWEAYLDAAPHGRFAPEARYNRALALVRLGRSSEAAHDLEAFAGGSFGGYRQSEARALLDALRSE